MRAASAKTDWISLRIGNPPLAGATVPAANDDVAALARELFARSASLVSRRQAYAAQLAALRSALEGWVSDFAGLVDKAFLVLKPDHLQFLVVLNRVDYQNELEDALTDLDLSIAHDSQFDLIRLRVLTVPGFGGDVLQSFLPEHST